MHRFLDGVFYLPLVFVSTSSELAVLFTEQPENTTALEGTTPTFSCAINNTAYEIVWYINGTNAAYTRIKEQGVRIISHNQTSSQLAVNASQVNNNSYIHCTAFQFVEPPFSGLASKKAFLRVEEMPMQQPVSISVTKTLTPANSSTESASPHPNWVERGDSPDGPSEEKEQQPTLLIVMISIPIVGSVVIIVCLITAVILVRKKCRSRDQKKDLEFATETIQMTSSIPYEYRQPMKFKFNIAYDDVELHPTPSPHSH